ncbi:MAG: aminomethyl-transferring glycine dehydrogenase [Candidatus Kapabacteria bacterium]|nr:aminomethyl-transferring glycine dehydrogenase [Candidatus Kapabacteria bacterium]
MSNIHHYDQFVNRHIGPSDDQINQMLISMNYNSLDELIDNTIPQKIRLKNPINIGDAVSEFDFLKSIKATTCKNKVLKSFIGLGYNSTITPAVILRNVLENPGWYTQYTPYQAEISQGRLEALINFQTMIIDLTGMEIANASLLDEGTAAAESMHLFHSMRKPNQNTFLVSEKCFPQTIDIIKTRASPLGINVIVGCSKKFELNDNTLGVLVQYPNKDGKVGDYADLFKRCADKGIFTCVATDILSLALLTPPGEFGADVVVGSTQRFGVPMGFGGPHAAYFATRDKYKRNIPGRMIGFTIDAQGNKALRMALQTREQHIKRERATSNICTAQVLLAIIAGMYAVYHGPKGVKAIAQYLHNLAAKLETNLKALGFNQMNEFYFDTIRIELNSTQITKLKTLSVNKGYNFNYTDEYVTISLGETTQIEDIEDIINIFAELAGKTASISISDTAENRIPSNLNRTSNYLTHQVFNSYHSETDLLRYLKTLENKDLSLTKSMIPLGSCTMKLNATSEMIPVTFPELGNIHPFAPLDQAQGYMELITELEKDLAEITGFAGVSLQPNSGAQGEYSGLMVIRAYHHSRGDHHRNVCVIPASAHGTNPASAVMAGMKVVVAKTNPDGSINFEDLQAKVEANKDNLAALMVTYPSTNGIFDENIIEVCDIIHANGGQVYMDGANMNAQVGLTSPGMINADVCHLNLHKTFCIPHGGGGPGVGPICVAKHLVEFLPGSAVVNIDRGNSISSVSAAPWGSASILVISYAFIKMMGGKGLKKATEVAILNANYLKEKLKDHYKVLFTGSKGNVAHELIFDMNGFKATCGIEVTDIAKRLMDYGFHAPTVSFPVPGTLMVEPTESEPLAELDRFIEAMISIRQEIKDLEDGVAQKENNILSNAPHTSQVVIADEWDKPYSRAKAAFPTEHTKKAKFWPTVSRVNDAYGDRNLVCSCNPIEDYIEN